MHHTTEACLPRACAWKPLLARTRERLSKSNGDPAQSKKKKKDNDLCLSRTYSVWRHTTNKIDKENIWNIRSDFRGGKIFPFRFSKWGLEIKLMEVRLLGEKASKFY